MFFEHPGEIQGIFIAAQPGNLGNGVSGFPPGCQKFSRLLHPQCGQIFQRGLPGLLLEAFSQIIIMKGHPADDLIRRKVRPVVVPEDGTADLFHRLG